jgi:hypothetical protein
VRNGVSTDLVSLVSGAAIAALGMLVLLDSLDAIALSVGWVAVALTAAVGAILLVSGISRGSAGRHD